MPAPTIRCDPALNPGPIPPRPHAFASWFVPGHTNAMRVYLDDSELSGPINTLAHALDAARRAAGSRGLVIVEASADGAPLGDDILENPASIATQPQSVQFVSADPLTMVRVALLDAAEALQHARDDHAGVVSSLDAGDVDAARHRLDRVLTAWGGCIATVRDGGALLGLDMSRPLPDGTAPAARVANLSAALIEVKRCIAAQDWAGLADVVGDELERHAHEWDAMLRGLADGLKPAPQQ